MPPKLLIATRNQAKFNAFASILGKYKLSLLSLADLAVTASVDETGDNFLANAILKARAYQSLSQLPTLADDGGLEVDVLNGWPGVYSRRIFGAKEQEATDEEMIAEVLKRLQGIPAEQRTAKMRAVVALALNDKEIYTADIVVAGSITEQPVKTLISGFPFRSIFYLPAADKVAAELSPHEQEHFMNHRQQAIIQLEPYLKQLANYA